MRRSVLSCSFMTLLAMAALSEPVADAGESLPAADREAYLRGETVFPGPSWQVLEEPGAVGWDVEALRAAEARFEALESAALVAVHRGVVVASWGTTAEPYTAQSVRKSLVNALIGMEVDAGRLRLDATLGELGIDDQRPLTRLEKEATLRDLLLSRSGVYHPAIYEHGSWKSRKPAPGTHPPGEAWFYNNWGFNALGTIYERSSGRPVAEGFLDRVAGPLGMQDFRAEDVVILDRDFLPEKMAGNDSIHDAHVFRISTRDLARFGLLYLREGRWRDQQIVSAEWVRSSLEGVPIEGRTGEAYGFLWWIYTSQSPYWSPDLTPVYVAQGNRGHWLAILPTLDLVVAHQVATGGLDLESQLERRLKGSPEVSDADIGRLIAAIAGAAPAASP